MVEMLISVLYFFPFYSVKRI